MKKNLPLNKYFKTNISDIQNNSSLHLLWKLTFLFFQEIFLQPLVVMGTMWCTCNKIFKSWAAFKCISPKKKKKNRNVSGVVFKNFFLQVNIWTHLSCTVPSYCLYLVALNLPPLCLGNKMALLCFYFMCGWCQTVWRGFTFKTKRAVLAAFGNTNLSSVSGHISHEHLCSLPCSLLSFCSSWVQFVNFFLVHFHNNGSSQFQGGSCTKKEEILVLLWQISG